MPLKEILIISAPVITWGYFLYIYYKLQKSDQPDKKNNCVITYAANREMWGWFQEHKIASLSSLTHHFDPLLKFLESSNRSLDIAVMILSVNAIIEKLKELKSKGVRIRVIMDSPGSNKLLKNAVTQIKYYNLVDTKEHIFHNKYIIRDFGEDTCAILNGSLNLTMKGIFSNYENVVISTSTEIAEAYQKNYNILWDCIPEPKY